ncbi:hypothetical protein HYALB_00012105 [Hymenoscyphus albidus]|uniref:Nephrocystin 3-like N-terminal domain-containing protein n=1 Tax=Hymenoscyphus albidus TaxID=595503 RepID=A0A9N9LKL2_9HELO|nr:hypothetical protein HYALB_00012105 [Hymenoscyphus albidus]
MDGISAAASVVAIVDIASKVASLLKDYYEGVKNAQDDIKRLYGSIQSLQVTLSRVYDILNKEQGVVKPELFTDPSGPLNQSISSQQYDISADILREIRNARDENDRLRIIQWLSNSALDPSLEHQIARGKHEATTGSWLVANDDFESWMGASNSLLWLYGNAGSGKSILCSTAIDHIQRDNPNGPGVAVVYWYITFTNPEKQKVNNILRSLITDICSNLRDTPQLLWDTHRKYNFGNQQPDYEDLMDMLKAVVTNFKDIYVLLDALDECPKTDAERPILSMITRIHEWNIASLHLLVTSRKEVDILRAFNNISNDVGYFKSIAIQGSHVKHDIVLFLEENFKKQKFSRWKSELKKTVSDKLATRADGMLPKTLYSIYEHTILQTDEQKDRQFARRALHWISSSPRPVSLQELAEAVIVRPDDEGQRYVDEDERIDEEALLEILPAGLVTRCTKKGCRPVTRLIGDFGCRIPEPSIMISMVQFAHFSVQEFLQSDDILIGRVPEFHLNPTASDLHCTDSCFAYLLFVGSQKPEVTIEIFERFPLFDYARTCWPYHFHKIEMLSKHTKPPGTSRSYLLALGFLKGDSEAWKLSTTLEIFHKSHNNEVVGLMGIEQRLRNVVDCQPILLLGNDAMEPISFLSSLGFESLLEKILSVTPKVRISDSGYSRDTGLLDCHFKPPLHNAASCGHTSIVKLLLEHGFDVNQGGDIARVLLEAGADFNIDNGGGITTLIGICIFGSFQRSQTEGAIKLLLEAGADQNAIARVKREEGDTLLLLVARCGAVKPASLLLQFGANINFRGEISDETPLEAAALKGKVEMVNFLLDNGAGNLGRQRTDWLGQAYAVKLWHAAIHGPYKSQEMRELVYLEEMKTLNDDSWESTLKFVDRKKAEIVLSINHAKETSGYHLRDEEILKSLEEIIRISMDARARLRGPDGADT